MNSGPQKPRIQRPPALSSPEVSSVRLGRVSKPIPVSKTGLFISLGIHACLIAAACFITFHTFGEKGKGDDNTAGDHGDFQMLMSSREPQAESSEPVSPLLPQPIPPALPQIPITALRNLPAIQRIPPIEQATAVTANKPSAPPSTATSTGKSPASGGPSSVKAGGKKGSGGGRQAKAPPPATPPKLLSAPPPRYPAAARAAKKSGKVGVLVRVRGDGSAASTSVYQSSGSPQLDQAATEAARGWKFSQTPSLDSGATVSVVVQVTFDL
jgi:TonB family protein